MNRIALIGNGGGGKTTLSRRLQELYGLPLTHVDSIQFKKGMKAKDQEQTRKALLEIESQERWIIDGFGPMDVMKSRFQTADRIVFVDFPLWRHYWWCTKRQVKSIWRPRVELPEGCNEATISHTIRLFKVLWRVEKTILPELREFFTLPEIADKVVKIGNLQDWSHCFENGVEVI